MTPRAALSREWMRSLRQRGLEWVRGYPHNNHTANYADLIFAFGLGSVGDAASAVNILVGQGAVLTALDEAHRECFACYEYRIREALAGRPHGGTLPAELMTRLEGLNPLIRYVVDRLRKQSRVVEPDDQSILVAARVFQASRTGDFYSRLNAARDLTDPVEFKQAVEALVSAVPPDNQYQVWALALGRPAVASADLLQQAINQMRGIWRSPEIKEQRHFVDHSRVLIDALRASSKARLGEVAVSLITAAGHWIPPLLETFPPLAGQLIAAAVEALWEFRMGEEADEFLNVTTAAIAAADVQPARRLQPLLAVADGWYRFGFDRLAEPAAGAARETLSSGQLVLRDQVLLIQSLAAAVRNAPQPAAESNLGHLFALPSVRDTYTTASHFSVATLEVLEAIVLSAVNVCRITDTWNIPSRG
jgi:hypothetical protein